EARVLTHAIEPVAGIRIVGLAPVHDSMNITSIGGLNFLCKGVSLVEMIVPKVERCANKLLGRRSFVEQRLQLPVDFGDREGAGTVLRSRIGRFGCAQQLAKLA